MDREQLIKNQIQVSTTLATHLFSQKFRNSNVVFSPISIHVVLSFVAAGSKGPTLDRLLSFLKANNTDDLNSLSSYLVSVIFADGSENDGTRISLVNGVWADKTLSLKPSFKPVVDTVYKATFNQVDFQTKADKVAGEVNLWVEKHTNSLIKQVISPDAIDSLTRLIFANAVYFRGSWEDKFDRSETKDFDFHLLDGNKVQVPFMTPHDDYKYVGEYDGFRVAGLPYLFSQFTMYIFLPDAKDGLQSLVEKMGSMFEFFDHHIPDTKVEVGKFLLPKFKISLGFEASDVLKKLGVVLEDEDCLSEMVDSSIRERLNVFDIYHNSFVKVNEEGTEAAAVSLGVMCGCGLGYVEQKVDFVADHPFLFVIREDRTGLLLFMGQVTNPHVE